LTSISRQAKDEIARTPLFVVDWLAHEATADETPVDLLAVPAELRQATADQLIALVFAGHIDRIVPAVYELRVRYLRAKDGDITSRAWERYEDEIKRAEYDDNHFWF
jgi:ABC-type branched-subunit amino acid transport system substrate-binding protein